MMVSIEGVTSPDAAGVGNYQKLQLCVRFPERIDFLEKVHLLAFKRS